MPELHKVGQMLPAGWGGTGSVLSGTAISPTSGRWAGVDDGVTDDSGVLYRVPRTSVDFDDEDSVNGDSSPAWDTAGFARRPAVHRKCAHSRAVAEHPGTLDVASPSSAAQDTLPDTDLDFLDIPAFLNRQQDDWMPPSSRLRTPLALSDWVRRIPWPQWPRTYADLTAIGVGAAVLDWLELIIAVGDQRLWEEETVVATFLHCLGQNALNDALTDPEWIADSLQSIAQRLRESAAGQPDPRANPRVDPNLAQRMLSALQGITAENWPDGVYALTA
jgi:Ca-activated chloride channel homolog